MLGQHELCSISDYFSLLAIQETWGLLSQILTSIFLIS